MPNLTKLPSKRQAAVLAIASIFLVLGLWAFWIEPSRVIIHHITLQIPRWHPEHREMRIAILTDLHVGAPHMGVDKLKRVVEYTNRENPDLVVILGDLVIDEVVGGQFVEPEPIAEQLKGLRAPQGVVAVLGNHDWSYNGVRVTEALKQAGIVVLENGARRIELNDQSFWIVGIADLWTRQPDINGSLRQVDETNPVILITHNPDIFPDVPPRVSLTLAGHTHGGQVNIPIVGRPVVPSRFGQRYAMGHIIEHGRHMFVSGGIGTSIIPVRFRVPPEIIIMKLTA